MTLPDIADRTAIRDYITVEAPLAAQNVDHQSLVSATGFSVRAVVSTHHRICSRLNYGGAKRGQISLAQISFRGRRVERVALRFRTTVHGIMLWGGDYFEVLRVISLQTPDEFNAQPRRQIRVFAVSLLSPPPARVAKNIDVGTPESQPFVATVSIISEVLVIFCPRFGRDHLSDLMHQFGIPRG